MSRRRRDRAAVVAINCLALSRVVYATSNTHAGIVAALVEEFDKVRRQTLSEIQPN
jgi:hypothetical protein